MCCDQDNAETECKLICNFNWTIKQLRLGEVIVFQQEWKEFDSLFLLYRLILVLIDLRTFLA